MASIQDAIKAAAQKAAKDRGREVNVNIPDSEVLKTNSSSGK